MPTAPSTQIHTTITGTKGEVFVVVHNVGLNPLPPSAGQATVIQKGAVSQVLSVHGTTAGVAVDIPA